MKSLKRIKPGTWVVSGFVAFLTIVAVLVVFTLIPSQAPKPEVALALYNSTSVDRKVGERVELAVRLNLKDTTSKKFEIQLEGRQAGTWQVVKKYTATKASSTIVFRVRPAKVGNTTYRAEVMTATGVLITNELVLHITK